ncbi:MAG: mechanosensitive ion channel domain-containing protein [Bacteroidota bacterium]
MSLLKIVFLGLVLFVALRFFFYFLRIISKGSVIHKNVIRIIPVFELILWTAYLFGAVYMIFSKYTFMPSLLAIMGLILCILIAWYILRDLIAGVVLKSENVFENGQFLKANNTEGRIKKIGYLYLELENNSGENIKIPYSRLSNQILIRPETDQSNKYALIRIEIPKVDNHIEIKEKLIGAMNSTPWVIFSQPPEIQIKVGEDKTLIVEIRYISFSDEQTFQLKNYLEEFAQQTFK